jgi:hypothetical protein
VVSAWEPVQPQGGKGGRMAFGGGRAFVPQLVQQPNGWERPAQLGSCAAYSGQQPQLGVWPRGEKMRR